MAGCGNPIPTVGCTLFVDNVTEGTADQAITGHISLAFSGTESSEIDATALCDTEKQYINGLLDTGSVDIGFNTDYGDVGQQLLRDAIGSNDVKTFKFVLPNDQYITWTAIVRTSSVDFGLDTKVESAISLRLKSSAQAFESDDTAIGNA